MGLHILRRNIPGYPSSDSATPQLRFSESLQTAGAKMFAIRNGLRNTSRLSGVVARTYTNSMVSAPPQVKISTAEQIFSFFCVMGALLISPMYFAPNFKNYAKTAES